MRLSVSNVNEPSAAGSRRRPSDCPNQALGSLSIAKVKMYCAAIVVSAR